VKENTLGQRLRGEDVSVNLLVDGVAQVFVNINSFEFQSVTEVKEEGYLGEHSDRYDEIYKGYSGNFKMHNSGGELFTFLTIVKDRAQRRTPGVVINIKATLVFPSGERVRVILKNAFFETSGIATGSRDAYAESTIPFKGSDWKPL
jgi:hypothetical protein